MLVRSATLHFLAAADRGLWLALDDLVECGLFTRDVVDLALSVRPRLQPLAVELDGEALELVPARELRKRVHILGRLGREHLPASAIPDVQ